MARIHVIGKPARRVDALEKTLGTAKYVGDYDLPEMLYARVLRSDLPHAHIKLLNVAPALDVPGVKAVITWKDYFDHGSFGWPVKDSHILAFQEVRYVGEGIAAVAAETEEAALAGVKAIVLELEPLPTVFDKENALDPSAVQVGPSRSDGKHPNFLDCSIVKKGDAQAMLEACAVTIDKTYHTQHIEHAYLETEGALAMPTPEGGVIAYSPSQSPFVNQGILALVLGLPPELVRVIQPPVGGSFGGKDDLTYISSAQVAKLALITGKPVKMVLSREESFIASYKRDSMVMHISLGADRDGTLRACKFEGILDSGAYASVSPLTGWRASIHAPGAYRYDACDVDITSVYTNNGFSGAMRGFGNTEVCYAIEQAIDEMAYQVGFDPLVFRLKNCLRLGDEIPHGQVLTEAVGLTDCLMEARRLSDWDRKRQEYPIYNQTSTIKKGIGVAALFHGISQGAEGADYAASTITVENDKTVIITSGLTDYGPGSRTVYTMITAEELGILPERIKILRPDTNTAIESGATVASRTTVVGGNAIRLAARNLAQMIDLAAADLLRCQPSQLIREGEAFIGPNEEPAPWDEIIDHARKIGLILSAHGKWNAPPIAWDHQKGCGTPYFAYHFGSQVADIEVDTLTGKVDVKQVWAVHDSGKIIFPQGAYGQLYGGVTMGMGYALLERVDFEKGYIQVTNFDEYLIPTSMDMPKIHIEFIETDNNIGPYGAKNIAEPAMVPTAPAILNAIYHATGKRIRDIPANLERVLLGKDLYHPGDSTVCKLGLSK